LLEEVRQVAIDWIDDRARTPNQRIDAARALGLVGDPRFPVTTDEWRRELVRRNEHFGAPEGYWCYIRPSTYRIGGWEARKRSADITLPAFWIARFPVAVAQYAPFAATVYRADAERWWTPNGWKWKQGLQQPRQWDDTRYADANQAVIGVNWYEAATFCAWLSEQLRDALPEGYDVRLPSEAEWEAAAAYDESKQRRAYPWGGEEATPERAIYGASGLKMSPPIGCCPAGVAACGALDMAGNVWEWCTSSYQDYPVASATLQKDFTTNTSVAPLRGASWFSTSTFVRCGARDDGFPLNAYEGVGFRVVLAPRSH
jgi:formylglycine-generating enzyme required for sulfatase activity